MYFVAFYWAMWPSWAFKACNFRFNGSVKEKKKIVHVGRHVTVTCPIHLSLFQLLDLRLL